MKQKPWESTLPQTPKNRDRKRCYVYWLTLKKGVVAGGKVVWLTDKEKTFTYIKHPNIVLNEVVDKDRKELYKKYLHQTVD
jgi:hypothetical protein